MAGLKITEEKANTAQQSGVLGIVPVEAGKERAFVYLAPSLFVRGYPQRWPPRHPSELDLHAARPTPRRGEGGGVQAPEAGGCRRAENFPRLQVGLDNGALSSVRSKLKPPPPSTK